MRQMTKRGYDFLENEEGERLFAYDDATGKRIVPGDKVRGTLTIGVGHTGPDVYPGQTITDEESRRLFDKDTDWAEELVEKLCVGPNGETPNDNEFDALSSLAFNLGKPQFTGSSVVRMWQKGDRVAAGKAFASWKKTTIDGVLQDSPTLIGRRAREQAIYFTPVPGAVPKPMPQAVENPAKVATVGKMVTAATATIPPAAIIVENAKPAIEAIQNAATTAQQATTAWSTVKDLLSPLANGHVLTIICLTIALAAVGYVAYRVIKHIRRGEVSV